MKRKLRLKRTTRPTFRVLGVARKVRGTPFDLFGRTAMRRMERDMAVEYATVIEQVASLLNAENLDAAIGVMLMISVRFQRPTT